MSICVSWPHTWPCPETLGLWTFVKTVNIEDNLCYIVFPFFTIRVTEENGEWCYFGYCQVVSWRYIFTLFSCSDSPWSDNSYKSAKKDLWKVRKIVELISCQTNDTIPGMCLPKESLTISVNCKVIMKHFLID